ncbi:DUF4123 domain-containing protein [sulfur-oxidizing endosymbiont of Gigantopelta aegis]|uniref:DUF4123 domain-containing protein n=1 Tax=sulfur-oxidizing endosymbiont of Gigantopelta aegis TaxID=2794934 RepID=UPI0018DB6E61|nr:DUF4123 domain-containing protein [sulfur-oxidizing endosymbiont of Gigantopelta aegis]
MSEAILHHPLETIHQILLNGESNVYALIDINSRQSLRGELFNLSDDPIFYNLFHATAMQELRDQSPCLIQIQLNQYDFLTHLLNEAPEHFMLIFSNHHFETLSQHWQSLLTVYALDGEVAIFKFYTAQILGPYLKACQPYEQAQLLAFCDAVYLYDELDKWSCVYQLNPELALPLSDLKKIDPPLKTAWWHLKEAHFIYLQSLTEQALISNLGDHLLEWHLDALLPYQNKTLSKLIQHGIKRARHYGLKTREELSFFLGLMFELAADFDEHPKIQQWLINRTPDTSVLALVDQMHDTVWDSMHNDPESPAWKEMPNDSASLNISPLNIANDNHLSGSFS